jgi:hypothetical protein
MPSMPRASPDKTSLQTFLTIPFTREDVPA